MGRSDSRTIPSSQNDASIEPLERRTLFAVDLVKDTVPGPTGSISEQIVEVGGIGYFVARNNDDNAQELWRTDGTSAGTTRITSLGQGVSGSLQAFDDQIIFGSSYAGEGHVWTSDGTAEGTYILVDVSSSGWSQSFAVVGQRLLFTAPVVSGTRNVLWATDGTRAGTSVVATFNSAVDRLIRFGDTALLSAEGAIWRTDGTAGGTRLVKRIQPDSRSSHPLGLTSAGNVAYFGIAGQEAGLWRSDGTASGTFPLVGFFPQLMTPSEDGTRLYFFRETVDVIGAIICEVWVANGTVEGTQRIHTLGYRDPFPSAAASIGGYLYFLQNDDDDLLQPPVSLLRSDGQTLTQVQHFSDEHVYFPRLRVAGGALYFMTETDDTSTVWRSDGTTAGTARLTSFAQPESPSTLGEPAIIDGRIVFAMEDGVHGRELFALTSAIAGNVFADVGGDGIRGTADYGKAGFRVFIDRDNDGICDRNELQTRTSVSGRYTFADLPAGAYWVRVTPVDGWRATTNLAYRVVVPIGGSVTRHFGVTRNVLITGTVFMDANKDGGKDAAEPGLSAWRVFVDADGDGILDDDETSVLTDATGRYAIGTLAGGTHQIRVVQQTGYRRTSPAAGYRTVSLFPGTIAMKVNFGEKRIA